MPIPDYILKLRSKVGHTLLLLPGVTAVVCNDRGELLLQRRSDTGEWSLLSGVIDPGEEPADTVIREVQEETGLTVIPERLSGVYSGPDFYRHYPNGDEAIYVDFTFVCRLIGENTPRINDDESLELRYFARDALPPMEAHNRYRLEQALGNDERAYFRLDSADGDK